MYGPTGDCSLSGGHGRATGWIFGWRGAGSGPNDCACQTVTYNNKISSKIFQKNNVVSLGYSKLKNLFFFNESSYNVNKNDRRPNVTGMRLKMFAFMQILLLKPGWRKLMIYWPYPVRRTPNKQRNTTTNETRIVDKWMFPKLLLYLLSWVCSEMTRSIWLAAKYYFFMQAVAQPCEFSNESARGN